MIILAFQNYFFITPPPQIVITPLVRAYIYVYIDRFIYEYISKYRLDGSMSEETDRGDLRGRGKQAQITRVAVHSHTHTNVVLKTLRYSRVTERMILCVMVADLVA